MDSILAEMEFEALAGGEFTASAEAVRNVIGNENVLLLDVRTTVESSLCNFPFTKNIPLHQLPERFSELPADKIIITLGASAFEAAVAFFYLRQAGFETVKTMVGGPEQLAVLFKPAPLYAHMQQA